VSPDTPSPGGPAFLGGPGGFTDADLALYLAHNPAFFERHAELLASIQLASPHGTRAVSLHERQIDLLRDRIKGLEARIMEMIRHGQSNLVIAERIHRCTQAMLLAHDAAQLPARLIEALRQEFLVPAAGLRLWDLAPAHAAESWAQGASDDARTFAASLSLPYCGTHSGFEAAGWLEPAGPVASLALLPLRHQGACFGLLVLGSPDATRFAADMGTDFLVRIGEVASAALSRLREPLPQP